jgi:hypothetical protein
MTLGIGSSAKAADLGMVTISGTDPAITVSPNLLNAQVGDTFTITNTSNRDVSLRGSISRILRDPRNCESAGSPYCVLTTAQRTDTFVVDALGSFTVTVYTGGGFGAVIGTVTLSGSAGTFVPPLATFTLEFIGNDGTCSVTNSGPVETGVWTTVPTVAQCTREGHTLLGWNPKPDGSDPLGFAPGGSTLVTGANTLYAIWQPNAVTVNEPPRLEASITIIGERGSDGDQNRVFVVGSSTGLQAGTIVTPYFRFPGETGFTQGTGERTIDADGGFTWSRKTGKRIAVQFRANALGLRSNTVVIAAR